MPCRCLLVLLESLVLFRTGLIASRTGEAARRVRFVLGPPATDGQDDQLAAGNGLQPGTPATWSVEGVLYASYPEALLAWIEKLKAQG